MLTIEEVKAMSKEELFKLEDELLAKMEYFGDSEDLINNKWFQEIHNDYVLVSDITDAMTDEDLDDEDWEAIEGYKAMLTNKLLGSDPAKTRRSTFKAVK